MSKKILIFNLYYISPTLVISSYQVTAEFITRIKDGAEQEVNETSNQAIVKINKTSLGCK